MGLRAKRGSSRSTFEGKRLMLRVCVLIPSAPMYSSSVSEFGLNGRSWDVLLFTGAPFATKGSDMGRVVLLEYKHSTSASRNTGGAWVASKWWNIGEINRCFMNWYDKP